MMKFVYAVGGLVLVSILGVMFYASSIVSGAIEKFGSDALGVPVTVKSVNIGIFSGEVGLEGLVVANPQGFEGTQALSLGEIFVSLDPASVLTNKIHIKEVRITKPVVSYEGLLKKNNFKTIQNNVNAYTSAGTKSTQPVEEKSQGSAKSEAATPSKKIQLDLFVMEEATMNLRMTTPVGSKNAIASLPRIMIKNIGKEGDGADISEVVKQITTPLMRFVSQGATSSFANLGDLKQDTVDGIKGTLENKKDKALEGIKGLFGK
tara:strand:- start:35227 stop:36015 length:789 start_codon:yes stop_codon:yes gene_type:complete